MTDVFDRRTFLGASATAALLASLHCAVEFELLRSVHRDHDVLIQTQMSLNVGFFP